MWVQIHEPGGYQTCSKFGFTKWLRYQMVLPTHWKCKWKGKLCLPIGQKQYYWSLWQVLHLSKIWRYCLECNLQHVETQSDNLVLKFMIKFNHETKNTRKATYCFWKKKGRRGQMCKNASTLKFLNKVRGKIQSKCTGKQH